MLAKKSPSAATRPSSRPKRSRPNIAPLAPASVLSQAVEVPAQNVTVNDTVQSQTPSSAQVPASTNQVPSGALDVSSLVTTISASIIQSLKAAGISALSSSSPNPVSDPSKVTQLPASWDFQV